MLVIFDSRGWPEIRLCPEAAPGRLDVFTTSLFDSPRLLHGRAELPVSGRETDCLPDRHGRLYHITSETFDYREIESDAMYACWNFQVSPMKLRHTRRKRVGDDIVEAETHKQVDLNLVLQYLVPEKAWLLKVECNFQVAVPLVGFNPHAGIGGFRFDREEVV